MAGIKEKDKEFWERIEEWDVIGLVETGVEKKERGYWRERVLKEYSWIQGARRESRKGDRGDMVRDKEGVRERGRRNRGGRANSKRNKMGKRQMEDRNGIYKREDGEGIGENKNGSRRKGRRKRTEERGEMEEEDEERKRRSKNKEVNKKGEKLIKWVEEERWGIINGVKKRKRKETVIDYVIRDREA